MTGCTIVYIGAALFMHIENLSVDRTEKIEFFEAIYFIVVTMTTGSTYTGNTMSIR